jgi:hypothetical protein
MANGLFGIDHSNRTDKQHWTKNCFNSSFPTSLACYMMEENIPAIYAHLKKIDGKLQVVCDEISIRDVFRCGNLHAKELEFDFESKFVPFQQYSFDAIDGIDLVVKDLNNHYLAPVEIKLTVLPTSATSTKPEGEWGCEIVVRSATTSYCALQVWDNVNQKATVVRDIFEDTCSDIGDWTNDYEMAHKTKMVREQLDIFENEFLEFQKPLVMQPFWKTKGQSPILCDAAFDIVIWSDLAFSRLFIETDNEEKAMSRPMRASARMARCLWELSKSGKIRIAEIYRQMAFGQQTDKEVSVPGDRWRHYITTIRTIRPVVSKYAISKIIAPEYLENLMPERRFDQTLFFTAKNQELYQI